MKPYTKPCIEYVELRAEESLASPVSSGMVEDKDKGNNRDKDKDKDNNKDKSKRG